jgi:transposase-like protein
MGFRCPSEAIVVPVRWYLRHGLSYRDVKEMLAERGSNLKSCRTTDSTRRTHPNSVITSARHSRRPTTCSGRQASTRTCSANTSPHTA